ncbi:MAG TPA: selenocysteine-specific translation elongation factor, partial [Acidobacteriaceae bacterium]|nr:selenocysteine-specific translation elongation factor [Acidobacteriaceae bacterium]
MKGPQQGGNLAQARSVVLGTAGHIDHGKTALVLALTGTDTDRLPEEKARGITIDLGFAALHLVGPGGRRFDVSLIDVPGHHAFVRNMLAGAGGIDAVMLVVAADDGVKAQTVEHLQICRLLGIERGLVVLTKRDAVNPQRLSEARDEVTRLVEGTFLEEAPMVAVSALRQEGIGELKAALTRLVAEVPARSQERVMRLPVDRVFTVRGFGTVVTGTLQAGLVRAGESLKLEPGGRAVRVRGVQVHGKAQAEVGAPNRVALNLAGVDVTEVTRGDTVVPDGTLEPVSVLDAEVDPVPGAPMLRHRQRVRVHAFASETLATVLLYQGSPEGARLVRLRLVKPMVLAPGDRFVLRQPSPALTLGGG